MSMHLNELINDHQFQQLVKQFATGCKFHVSFCFVVIDVPLKQFNNHSHIIYPTTHVPSVTCFPCCLFFPIACLFPSLVFSYSLLLIHHSYAILPSCQHVHLSDMSTHLPIYLAFHFICLFIIHPFEISGGQYMDLVIINRSYH